MSDIVKNSAAANIVVEVDVQKKRQCLQTALYEVTRNSPFLGTILQCMDIFYTHLVPRAGIMFDVNGKKWNMAVNADWFCNKLSDKNREAVLLHEIYHITHKHPMRVPFLKINAQRRMIFNIAMDMAINQYIKHLPRGCQMCPPMEQLQQGAQCTNKDCPGMVIDVVDYFDFDKSGNKVPWPKEKPFEFYYHKLIERFEENEDENEGEGEEGDGEGKREGRGEGKGEGKGDKGPGNNMPQEFDSHHWDGNSEEKDMMDATEDLVKRAMQKRGLSMDNVPGFIRELLQDIEARRAELDYRSLILSAIKRHASGNNRKSTWTRMSRRFGNKAPGTKIGNLPKLANYIDSSGSISVQEANDFLDIIDNFLKVGSRKCDLGLWHTQVYSYLPYRLGERVDKTEFNKRFQSGGTDVGPTLNHIWQTKPDLSIILTDGCYSDVNVEEWMRPGEQFPQILWIISQNGMEEHPLRRLGETIKIPNTNNMKNDDKY